EDLIFDLEDKREEVLADRLDEILRRFEEDEDLATMGTIMDDFYDEGPFRLPPQKSGEPKQPANPPLPFSGKQLNLFDDES
ncbi:MAG: hypothetical protein HQL31_07060, partial [Planctomycetes bacterium]|nr:hypothetical protein [Planctomycetota bacterium]